MDGLMLHELPCKQCKRERSSVPVDRRVNVDGFQCGKQLSMLFLKRWQERLTSQRADVVILLSRPGPVHFSRRQRGIVDAAHADHVPQLLTKWSEAVANPMRCRHATRLPGRIGREVPFVVRDSTDKIDCQPVGHFAVAREVIDQHYICNLSSVTLWPN